MRAKKIISPRICQMLRTGLAIVKRSIMTLFQSHLPTKDKIRTPIRNPRIPDIISKYICFRLESDPDKSVKPSMMAAAAAWNISTRASHKEAHPSLKSASDSECIPVPSWPPLPISNKWLRSAEGSWGSIRTGSYAALL